MKRRTHTTVALIYKLGFVDSACKLSSPSLRVLINLNVKEVYDIMAQCCVFKTYVSYLGDILVIGYSQAT